MKKLLFFALCAVLALGLCAPALAYSDVDAGAWYAGAVDYCAANGLMDGMGDDRFDPDGAVTRAQLVTTLWRLAGKPYVSTKHGFSDVAEDAWYDLPLRWARYLAIANGVGDGSAFAPDGALTRAQLVTFFHRFAGSPAAEDAAAPADAAAIPAWAQTAARWAVAAGLMQGRGEGVFDPDSGATRAELATVLRNYAEKIGTVPGLPADETRIAPLGVAVDQNGDLLVTDAVNKVVWRYAEGYLPDVVAGACVAVDPDGENPGGYFDAPAAEALFASPWDIAPFLGGWAVSDPENDTVRLIVDGTVETLNGIPFDRPRGLAADKSGDLFVANTGDGKILRVTPKGQFTVVAEGLNAPTALARADGVLYIAETDSNRILRLADGGRPEVFAGAEESGFADGAALTEARFAAPQGLAVGPDGTVYVSDTANSAVRAIAGGQVRTLLAPPAGVEPVIVPASPMGIALEADGTLTVCDLVAMQLLTVEK